MSLNSLVYAASAVLLASASLPETGPLPADKPGIEATRDVDQHPSPTKVPTPEAKPLETNGQQPPAAPNSEPPVTEIPGATDTDHQPKSETTASPPPPPIEKGDATELKACLADLRSLGAEFEEKPSIAGEDPGCGIEHPLEVKKISQSVSISSGAIMRCKTALALAKWTKEMVQPALDIAMPGKKLSGIEHASTYVCRLRNNATTGKISEHARGNAVDIASFKFSDGTEMIMKKRDEDSTLEGAIQRTATASACLYFTTVLSPGSDAAHQNHLHLDVLDRHDGYRYCR